MRKIRAYTILELTVTMLISAISITISYTAWDILSRSYKGFDTRSQVIAEMTMADKLIRKDLSKKGLLVRTDSGFVVQADSRQISYKFADAYILRNQYDLRIDTLRIAASEVTFSYEKETSEEGSTIDFISMNLIVDGQAVHRAYHKDYSSAELFGLNDPAFVDLDPESF